MKHGKRVESLEKAAAKRYVDKNCICYPHAAFFHTLEEHDRAHEIPCPIHGIPRFNFAFIGTPPWKALAPIDRHVCQCEPFLFRTAEEEGRVLTREEKQRAEQETSDYWDREVRRLGLVE